MMSYLPPGLFDRLRVRCCSLGFDFYNWKDHLLLFGNYERILIHKHSYPAGADSSSPAIYIKGIGIKAELNSLWKIPLNIFEVCVSNYFAQLSNLLPVFKALSKQCATLMFDLIMMHCQ